MNFRDQVFVNPNKVIDPAAEVIFVADLFAEDYAGGAELTSEALIQESPYKVQKLHSRDLSLAALSQGSEKIWVFGNFAQMNPELIPSIVANLKYSVLEYDYKYCKFRSPEKHMASSGLPCDCHNQITGKMISAFYYGAKALWWMSEKQQERYHTLFPFLAEKDNIVLSSVFDKKTLGSITLLRKHSVQSGDTRKNWVVLGSESWIKGFEAAKTWCEKNEKPYDVVWNLPYEQVLAKLASAEGFVYIPPGGDTCPRMVIEAKLLGCRLHINDNVQHRNESWFDTDNLEEIHEYLYAAPGLFWSGIRSVMEKKPKISGYTTTYNCVSQGYPFEECILSMLQFCDEVCVVDGGSADGTWEKLQEMSSLTAHKVKIKQIVRDWSHPRFAVFDGMQKAEARAMCTGDFCWQMDSDEIVHEEDAPKIEELCSRMPKDVNVVSLPVIEYWGGPEKVRLDIQPWKWRLSRNLPDITHGIPARLRRIDEAGHTYSHQGTDGCDMIHKETGEVLSHITFHTAEAENVRRAAVTGHPGAVKQYEEWFNAVIQSLPGVHHYSWYNMPRKIRTYKGYWTKHWNSLYDGSLEDTADTNMMFDLPWSQVTDEMIEARAKELSDKTGGWIWHTKWKGQSIPHIKCNRAQPKYMIKSSK
jgi:glycosyltransferase involved in cell wall biosynthesis